MVWADLHDARGGAALACGAGGAEQTGLRRLRQGNQCQSEAQAERLYVQGGGGSECAHVHWYTLSEQLACTDTIDILLTAPTG